MYRRSAAPAHFVPGLVVLIAAIWVLPGCDTSFDPFTSSDRYFSVGGYLGAPADTQFVRVTPLRQTVTPDTGPIDAEVFLEHTATGQRWTWRDSVSTFPDGRIGHNFYTVADLVPGETYRFTVRRADGSETFAMVTLPDSFPTPVVSACPNCEPSMVTVQGVKRLLDLLVTYRYRIPPMVEVRETTISYRDRVRPMTGGFFSSIYELTDQYDISRNVGAQIEVLEKRVKVVAISENWPDLSEVDQETELVPGLYSNVENGLGFLGGMVTKTVTWR